MHCWPVPFQACDRVPPLAETPGMVVPSVAQKRQVAAQYLRAASLSTDGRQRAHLRRRAAELILAR